MSDEKPDPTPLDDAEDALERLWPDRDLRERNLDIVGSRLRGLSSRTVARTFDVSIGHVKRLMRQWRSINPTLRHSNPDEILDTVLEAHTAAIEELALVSVNAKNEAVRVGAIKARLEALRTVVEILQATGNLPQDLGMLRVQLDQRVVSARIVAVLDKHGVGDEVVKDLLDALENTEQPLEGVEGLKIGRG